MNQTVQEIAMLRRELEMLMREREALLRVGGAAALFVAELDSLQLPEKTWNVAEFLAESLNMLNEDTLQEALETVGSAVQRSETAGAAQSEAGAS